MTQARERSPAKSILTSDLFRDKTKEREMMLQMFVANETKSNLPHDPNNAKQGSTQALGYTHTDDDFERAESGVSHDGQDNPYAEVEFDLTKTSKSNPKSVSFAKGSKSKRNTTQSSAGKIITRQNLSDAAEDFKQDQMREL